MPFCPHGLIVLVGVGPFYEVPRSHLDTLHSLVLLWMSTSQTQRPLPDNTQHSQQTDIHVPGGIRTCNTSKQSAIDQRLRPRGHWDRRSLIFVRSEDRSICRYFVAWQYCLHHSTVVQQDGDV
jgi:hypothetical protein